MPKKKTLEEYKKELYAERRKNTELKKLINNAYGEMSAYKNNLIFLKKYAEKAGTKKNEWKAKYIKLEEKYEKVKEQLSNLKKVKKK